MRLRLPDVHGSGFVGKKLAAPRDPGAQLRRQSLHDLGQGASCVAPQAEGLVGSRRAAHDQDGQRLMIGQLERLQQALAGELISLAIGTVEDLDAGRLQDSQVAINRPPADRAGLGQSPRIGISLGLKGHEKLEQSRQRQPQ